MMQRYANKKAKCQSLIQHIPEQGFGVAFSRKIDALLHSSEIEALSTSGETDQEKYVKFRNHQNKILTEVKNCEKEIFNDPRVYYTSKDHLSGETGTMSTILTNGYLYLYNQLLDQGLKVNADVDLRILLNLVGCSYENGTLKMPPEEVELLKIIVKKLLPNRKVSDIFTPNWYEEYKKTMIELETFLLETYNYYTFNQGRQKYGIEQATSSFTDNPLVIKASEKGYLPRERDQYRLWETRPPYASLTNTFGNYTTDQTIEKIIPFLKTLFPPTNVKQGTRGGKFTRKKLKRKHKTRRRLF